MKDDRKRKLEELEALARDQDATFAAHATNERSSSSWTVPGARGRRGRGQVPGPGRDAGGARPDLRGEPPEPAKVDLGAAGLLILLNEAG